MILASLLIWIIEPGYSCCGDHFNDPYYEYRTQEFTSDNFLAVFSPQFSYVLT